MNAADVRRAPNILLQFDLAMPFEALILNQLRRRPASRQAEWLRNLLVQGFLCECHNLRRIQENGCDASNATIETRIPPPALTVVIDTRKTATPTNPSIGESDTAGASTPLSFADLRKVIG